MKAALYYPWISVANPAAATDPTQQSIIDLPPSGHVCGIYARTDIQRGVWKANLLVRTGNEAVLAFYEELGYARGSSVPIEKWLDPSKRGGA